MNPALLASLGWLLAAAAPAITPEVPRIDQRFAKTDAGESPDFRQHVIPLMGKLGCNGRACHGSFQGQGGFRLSLFGYDFKADHENLLAGDEPRTNLKSPQDSLILQKPTLGIPHEGGERMKADSWQYRVLRKWVEDGAKPMSADAVDFVRLEITPAEMVATKKGDTWQLKAVAVWSDGSREDVTPLCRFQANNDQVAAIDERGLVTAAGPGDSHVVAFYDNGVVPVPVLFPVSDKVGPKYPSIETPTKIDQLVANKLRKLGIVPSETCTDAEFLRRVSLDVAGSLPSAAETEAFLSDRTPDKRSRKVDELLERPSYAAWWATKFCDWTGNNARYQPNGTVSRNDMSQEWYGWMEKRIAGNMPYDQLVEGIVLATTRKEGESFVAFSTRMSSYYHKSATESMADQESMPHYWSRTNFKTSDERALGFAYTFLGVRIQCAQCHKHPFDQWTKDDFDRFKGFFGRVATGNPDKDEYKKLLEATGIDTKGLNGQKLADALKKEMVAGKVVPFQEVYVRAPERTNPKAKNKEKDNGKKRQEVTGRTAKVLGGEEYTIAEMDDPRTALMDWMRADDNPYFARAIVNRVWSGYFHRGIVDPTDDLSLANPACNEELLDYLASAFREHHYDLKWLHREITSSRTYQLSWISNDTNRQDERNFSRAVPRRLPAEVAYDAVVQATASDPEAEKLTTSLKGRAIGDPIVDVKGGKGNASYALTVFGRSIRESNCDCDRSAEPSLLQTVYLQNDQQLLEAINRKGGWVDQIVKGGATVESESADRKKAARTVDDLMAALKKAKASNNKERVEKIEAALKTAKRQSQEANSVEKVPVKSDEVQAIVRQAYLRTVNRTPTDTEMNRATAYFTETGDLAVGTRDLLWALLNTKEFIVNH